MAVTGTKTVGDLCTDALRLAGVCDAEDQPSSGEMSAAVGLLDDLLKDWGQYPDIPFTYASQSLALTTAASYTLSPERPLRIVTARFKQDGTEIPMIQLTRQEYDDLPDKDTESIPTQFYYDRQREDALFYVWPVLSTAAGETVEITYERELEDVTSSTLTLDLPGEWWRTARYCLAADLNDIYESPRAPQGLNQKAEIYRDRLLASTNTGSVWFGEEPY